MSARASAAVRFRNAITAGLVLVLPVWITFILVAFVFRLLRDASLWVIEALLASPVSRPVLEGWGLVSDEHPPSLDTLPVPWQWAVAGAAVVLTVMLLYVLGMIATNVLGQRLIRTAELLVDRVPLVKTVYRASKQVLEMLTGESTRAFRQVVLVPFPSERSRTIGFVTNELRDRASGEDLLSVFVATTPNPTTGFLLIVRREDAVALNWTVEEAVKAVMSGGMLIAELAPEKLGGNTATT